MNFEYMYFQHGDSAVYWAARQGHVEVIKYLHEEGVALDTQNKVYFQVWGLTSQILWFHF